MSDKNDNNKAREYTKLLGKKENIFGDEIAYVERWDFSAANLNDDARIEAITRVASVCYANPNALGSDKLYNRLAAESIGLPSSSFEFVPVLLTVDRVGILAEALDESNVINDLNAIHFGEIIDEGDEMYLLTNYRALLYDYELLKDYTSEDFRKWFNTEEEAQIIKKHFNVYLSNIDIATVRQYVRHRTSWQELSRRYVNGTKVPFEFYISKDMKGIVSYDEHEYDYSTNEILELCVNHYKAALKAGVKAENARRVIPVGAYSLIWSAWQPKYMENFYNLRLDKHAQQEIRWLAQAKKELSEINQ